MTQGLGILEFLAIKTRIPKTKNTPNFSGVLGRSPYKICELGLSSLKASKNLEFLVINLEFLAINSRIPKPCVIPQLDWGISSQRILYRDPRVKPEDDIVGNSRIP